MHDVSTLMFVGKVLLGCILSPQNTTGGVHTLEFHFWSRVRPYGPLLDLNPWWRCVKRVCFFKWKTFRLLSRRLLHPESQFTESMILNYCIHTNKQEQTKRLWTKGSHDTWLITWHLNHQVHFSCIQKRNSNFTQLRVLLLTHKVEISGLFSAVMRKVKK